MVIRKITGAVFLSLDGVMQAPGGAEDRTGRFTLAGRLAPYYDAAVGKGGSASIRAVSVDYGVARRYDEEVITRGFAGHY